MGSTRSATAFDERYERLPHIARIQISIFSTRLLAWTMGSVFGANAITAKQTSTREAHDVKDTFEWSDSIAICIDTLH